MRHHRSPAGERCVADLAVGQRRCRQQGGNAAKQSVEIRAGRCHAYTLPDIERKKIPLSGYIPCHHLLDRLPAFLVAEATVTELRIQ
jgi:hypothetical protein